VCEAVIHISPTVIVRVTQETRGAVTVGKGTDEALLVFRGPEDARAFQEHVGGHDRRSGFELVGMDREDLSRLLEEHGLSLVAMPEPWTGTAGVDLFDADVFLDILDNAEASGDRPAE
jgi:hypothetical protein